MTDDALIQRDKELAIKSFKDDLYLQNVGFLTAQTALDYFCQLSNPFYDKTSNNELIKMQRRDISALDEMSGIQYRLYDKKEPHLYIIIKERRERGKDPEPLQFYYIIGGTVYQAPSLLDCVQSRLFNCMYMLNKTFHEVQRKAKYSPTFGVYYWDYGVEEEEEENVSLQLPRYTPYTSEIQLHFDKMVEELIIETGPVPYAQQPVQQWSQPPMQPPPGQTPMSQSSQTPLSQMSQVNGVNDTKKRERENASPGVQSPALKKRKMDQI